LVRRTKPSQSPTSRTAPGVVGTPSSTARPDSTTARDTASFVAPSAAYGIRAGAPPAGHAASARAGAAAGAPSACASSHAASYTLRVPSAHSTRRPPSPSTAWAATADRLPSTTSAISNVRWPFAVMPPGSLSRRNNGDTAVPRTSIVSLATAAGTTNARMRRTPIIAQRGGGLLHTTAQPAFNTSM